MKLEVWVVLCRIPNCCTPGITFVDVMASEETAQIRAEGHRDAAGEAEHTIAIVRTEIQFDNESEGYETVL